MMSSDKFLPLFADYPKVKLSLKTKTDSGVVSRCGFVGVPLCTLTSFSLPTLSLSLQEFDTSGSHDLDKNRTSGQLKTKLKFPDYGMYGGVNYRDKLPSLHEI